ncbi:MAG: sugar phosphate isomerase/epimerase [Ignavibacteriales bacterium]|nr:sugar phosphate isomerase/epimerase [Ignavibacteriales bacterium]
MKVYLSTWSIHRLFFQKLLRISQLPALAHSLGFDGVELEDIWFPSANDRIAHTLKSEGRRAGMPILIAVSNDFTVAGEEFPAQVRHMRKFLRLASRIGSGIVRVLVGSSRSSINRMPQVVAAFREIVPMVDELGLRLAVENHDRLSRDPENLLGILERVGSRRLGICLDLGNLNPRTRYASIEKLAPRAMVVHAKTYGFRPDGNERSIDYRRCIRILRKNGFRGPVVAEYNGPGDQIMGSLKTRLLVRRFL